MPRAFRRWPANLRLATVFVLGFAVVGVIGARAYWNSYYIHRGFSPIKLDSDAGQGTKEVVDFYSPALHREADYRVYLPPGYFGSRGRYPVAYMLHGSPGRPQVFEAIASIGVRLCNLIAEHKIRPMILVFPDGRIHGSTYSDSEWANTPSGDYESYVVEVVNDVSHRFHVEPGRRRRLIAGFSAGAYGAINITLHHLPVFGSLEVWSGYFTETRSGVFADASPSVLAYNSPIDYIKRIGNGIRRDPLNAFLFVGRADKGSRTIKAMATALRRAGANVRWAIYPGGHDWELWNGHIDQMLILASRDLNQRLSHAPHQAPRAPGPGPRRHRAGPRRAVLPRTRFNPPRTVKRRGSPPPPRKSRPRARGLLRTAYSSVLTHHGSGWHRHRYPRGQLLTGLLLALASAALINFGFLLQHHGLAASAGAAPLASIRAAFGSRLWLAGQALGWIGFATQVAAVAIAPLSLVQAFAAGGLALSVPLAAWLFGQRISRRQVLAVLLMAVALAVLPIALSTAHDRLGSGRLAFSAGVGLMAATVAVCVRAAAPRAVAAGIFYGVADAGIKAVSVNWRAHGSGALWSGWTVLALLGTLAGFLAFQTALRSGSAISSISLMSAFAALIALGCGLLAFGESLGHDDIAVAAHTIAIAVVLGCVPALAAAQAQIGDAGRRGRRRAAVAANQRTG